jgi:hypothetical protein
MRTYSRDRILSGFSRGRRPGLGRAAACVAVLASLSAATAAAASYPKPQPPLPALTSATFAHPPQDTKPGYRYFWTTPVPLPDVVRRDIAAMAANGAGSAEIGWLGTGSGANAWGGDNWADAFKNALQAGKDNGIRIDFYVGPNWPAVILAVNSINDPAAAKQLIYGRSFVGSGQAAPTSLPAPTKAPPAQGRVPAQQTLVEVVAARCSDAGCATQATSPKLLDRSTAVDITDRVDGAGNLMWTAPSDGGTWAVIAFWQTADGQNRAIPPSANNYVLDRFGVAGARAVTDF